VGVAGFREEIVLNSFYPNPSALLHSLAPSSTGGRGSPLSEEGKSVYLLHGIQTTHKNIYIPPPSPSRR
jgi:hypothetical protein